MYLCAVNNILANIMPRQERLQSATGIYHVMFRGINKQDIFEDDGDYLQTELHSQVIEGVWCGNTPALSIDRCLLWSYTEVMKKEKMITEPSPGHKISTLSWLLSHVAAYPNPWDYFQKLYEKTSKSLEVSAIFSTFAAK